MPENENPLMQPTTVASAEKSSSSTNTGEPSPGISETSLACSTTGPAPSEERYHHPYSPSTLGALEACPCFKGKESKHARTRIGTIAHESSDKEEDDARLSDDDAAMVAECLDFYEQRKQALLSFGPDIIEMKETYLVVDDEEFIDHDGKFVHGITAGYVDRAVIAQGGVIAEIFDWKFGRWAVEEASKNLQGIAYALGLLKKYPSLHSVRFWFKQPMIRGLTDAVITREQVPDLYLRIRFVVERAKTARATGDFSNAVPRATLCVFCANIAICPKVADLVCKVGTKYNSLVVPADITPSRVHSADETAMGLMLAQTVKEWANAYRRRVSDRCLRGDVKPPPGYELGTYARREIVDMEKFKQVALTALTPAEYEETLSTTFEGVESKVQEKAPRGSKESTLEAFQKKLVDEGAVKKGQPFVVLRSQSKKKTESGTPKQIN